jgi:hypothetical protein
MVISMECYLRVLVGPLQGRLSEELLHFPCKIERPGDTDEVSGLGKVFGLLNG